MSLLLCVVRRFLVAAAFVSASLVAAAPVEAFWGKKEITWDRIVNQELNSGDYNQLYDAPGWRFFSRYGNNVFFIKYFDCRGSHCIWFTKNVSSDSKSVWGHYYNCDTNQQADWQNQFHKRPWKWYDQGSLNDRERAMFCN